MFTDFKKSYHLICNRNFISKKVTSAVLLSATLFSAVSFVSVASGKQSNGSPSGKKQRNCWDYIKEFFVIRWILSLFSSKSSSEGVGVSNNPGEKIEEEDILSQQRSKKNEIDEKKEKEHKELKKIVDKANKDLEKFPNENKNDIGLYIVFFDEERGTVHWKLSDGNDKLRRINEEDFDINVPKVFGGLGFEKGLEFIRKKLNTLCIYEKFQREVYKAFKDKINFFADAIKKLGLTFELKLEFDKSKHLASIEFLGRDLARIVLNSKIDMEERIDLNFYNSIDTCLENIKAFVNFKGEQENYKKQKRSLFLTDDGDAIIFTYSGEGNIPTKEIVKRSFEECKERVGESVFTEHGNFGFCRLCNFWDKDFQKKLSGAIDHLALLKKMRNFAKAKNEELESIAPSLSLEVEGDFTSSEKYRQFFKLVLRRQDGNKLTIGLIRIIDENFLDDFSSKFFSSNIKDALKKIVEGDNEEEAVKSLKSLLGVNSSSWYVGASCQYRSSEEDI